MVTYKKGICNNCGKEKLIVIKSRKLCYICSAKVSAQRTYERKLKKGTLLDYSKLKQFYADFYNNHPTQICFETGVKIYNGKHFNVHHVLEKKDYPEHMFNTDICVLLTLEAHSLWHSLSNIDRQLKMPKTYCKLLELKKKYNINE
jgi:hypothetical protein